jgi:uncharacterized protein (TIGR01777 family)
MVMSRVGKTVLVTGGTGFIGRKLTEALSARGDSVTVLTRDPSRVGSKLPRGARAVAWDPLRAGPWQDEIGRAEVVVHLAGENVAKRWTEEAKRAIVASRVEATRLVVEGMRRAEKKPEVFVSASAVGFYGPQPGSVSLDEGAPRGEGFLADVVVAWEAEAKKAEELSIRTPLLRIGVVLGEGGGALEKMLLPFKLFAGGPIGSGEQVVPWVHADDVVGLALLSIDDERARGPINVVAPMAVTNAELAREIGRALGRPSWIPTPTAAIKVALGSEAASIVTTGQRVRPARAETLGYTFRYPDLAPALRSILK